MNASKPTRRFLSQLAVCGWSIQPETPQQLVDYLNRIGLNRVQLDLDPFREHAAAWSDAPVLFAESGIQPVSGMFRTVGEDYSTLETIRVTGGVVPDSTWEQNWSNAQVTARTATRLGLSLVMFHAGFLPHDPNDPAFKKLAGRVSKIARLFAESGITLGLETGQETAAELKVFLEILNEPNVAVNFDPANMLLYDKGDPVEALRTLGPWVKGVHLKDAFKTKVPGTWGEERAVGTGEVDWSGFFTALADVEYQGWLCFEREAGDRRVEDIRDGRLFVESLLGV